MPTVPAFNPLPQTSSLQTHCERRTQWLDSVFTVLLYEVILVSASDPDLRNQRAQNNRIAAGCPTPRTITFVAT
jgi:hypothetical protein